MALSGSVKTGSYEGRYYLLEWTATQSESGNYSTVSWTLSCAGGSAGWYAERTLEVKIAGSKVYSKTDRVERRKGPIKSGTKVINHDDDGNASFDVSVRVAVYVDTVNCTGSKTFTLDQITRRSTLTVADGTLGTSMTIPVTRRQETHVHTVTAECGSATPITLCTQSTSTSLSYTPPVSWASQNTTGTTVTVVYKISTYEDGDLLGTTKYTTTCAIPESVKPTCNVDVVDNAGYLDKANALVKGKSKLSITINPAIAYGSDISSYSLSIDGVSYSSQTVQTNEIKSSGSTTLTASVTDKRGRTGTYTKTYTILEYKSPVIKKLIVHRCNSDGTENDEGDYIKVTWGAKVVNFAGLDNTVEYQLQYKHVQDTEWTTIYLNSKRDVFDVTDSDYVFEADGLYAWDVQLVVKDAYEEVTRATKASTAYTLVHYRESGKGIAFGGMCEEDDFWCKMPAHFKRDVNFEGDVYVNGDKWSASGTGGTGSGYPDAKDYGYVSGGGFSGFQISYSMYTGISEFIRDPVTIATPSAIQFAGYFDFSDLARYSGAKAAIVRLPIAENQAKCIGFGVKMPDGNIYIISNNCEFYSNEVTLGWGRFSDGSYSVSVKIDYSGLYETVKFTYTSAGGVSLFVRPHMRDTGIYPPAMNYGYVAGSFDGYRVTYDYNAGKAAIANELTTVNPTNNHFAGYFDFSDTNKFSGIKHAMCKLQLPENVTRADGIGVKLPNGNIYYAVTNDMQSDEVGILWANYSDIGYTVKFKYGNYSGWEDWYVSYKSGNSPEVTSYVRPVLQYSHIENWINAEGSGAGGTESIPSAETIGYVAGGSFSAKGISFSHDFVDGVARFAVNTSDTNISGANRGYFDFSEMPTVSGGLYRIPLQNSSNNFYIGFKGPDGIIRYIYRQLMSQYCMVATRVYQESVDGSVHNLYQFSIVFWADNYYGGRAHDAIRFIWDKTSNHLRILQDGAFNATEILTATKAIYDKIAQVNGGSAGCSVVTVTPALTGGTKIADITVDGANKVLYAPDTGDSVPSATTIGYKEGSHSGYNLTISGNTVTVASSATTKTNTYTVGYFDWSGDIEEVTGDFSVPTKIHGYVAGLGFKMPDGKIYDIAAVRLNTNIIHVNKWRGGTSGAYTYNYNVTISLIAGNTLNLNFTYKTDTKELTISNKSYSSGGGGGSTVSINRKVSTGTNIADITIDGTTTQLWAPTASGGSGSTVTVTNRNTIGTKIATINIDGSANDIYAPSSSGGGGDTVSISDRRTTGTKIAKITINGVDYDIYAPASTGGLQAMEDISWKESS